MHPSTREDAGVCIRIPPSPRIYQATEHGSPPGATGSTAPGVEQTHLNLNVHMNLPSIL